MATKKTTSKTRRTSTRTRTVTARKKVTAKKAPAKKTPAGASRANKKIKVIVSTNPHREGSNRAKKFACLKGGKTVKAAIAAMQKAKLATPHSYVSFALQNKWIELAA